MTSMLNSVNETSVWLFIYFLLSPSINFYFTLNGHLCMIKLLKPNSIEVLDCSNRKQKYCLFIC